MARRAALLAVGMLASCGAASRHDSTTPPTAETPTVVHVGVPHAETWGSSPGSLSVRIDADGTLRVDGLAVTDDQLRARAGALAANPDAEAILWADDKVPYGRVVQVVDMLTKAGISRVAFRAP